MSEAEKKARLAEALRANLRKRKAQARASACLGETSPTNPSPEGEGLEKKD